MAKQKVALGIDIGGTNTVFGLVTREGQIVYRDSFPTEADKPFDDFFDRFLKKWNESKLAFNQNFEIVGIGAGAPNANFYKGTIENPPNLKWGKVDFVQTFKRHFDMPIFITNDANAAAMGEKLFGAAKDVDDFIEVTLGTGLGSGIISNGHIVYGHDGFAGELGHVIVKPNGRLCGCGNRGCLETYASATGIVRTALELLANENTPSSLRKVAPSNLNSKMIYDAAKDGDKIAQKAFEYTADVLGQGLATGIALFSPKMIVLFGGLAKAGELLLDPTVRKMNEYCFTPFKNKVEIKISSMPEGDAAILGSAALVWNEIS